MQLSFCLPILIFALGLAPSAAADIFETPIPTLVGTLRADEPPPTHEFDFGVEFDQVLAVWLEIEATGTPWEWDFCGSLGNPQPCEHVVVSLGLVPRLDEEEFPIPGFFDAEELGPFNTVPMIDRGEFCGEPFRCPAGVPWDFLLDGDGGFRVFVNGPLFLPEDIVKDFVLPLHEIVSARLIVDATPLP